MATPQTPFITVGELTLPPFNVVVPVSITIGRDDPTAQPDANSLSFGWIGETFPSAIERGARVAVWFAAPSGDVDVWDDVWDDVWEGEPASEGTGSRRFVGRVADVAVTPDPRNNLVWATVNCVGTLVDFADQIVGDEPWPIETDQDRALRLAALVRTEHPFIPEGSQTLRLRRRDADRRKLLELLHLFGGSVGSIVWEYPDGSIHYQRYDVRQVPDPAGSLHLPPQAIIADAEWVQSSDQLIDRVRVEYGDDPPEGNRPEVVVGGGKYETRMSGDAADVSTAQIVADTILARWGRRDVWDVSVVNTKSRLLEQTTYDALLAVLPGDPLHTGHLTQTPSPGRSGEGMWFVEGWEEVWDRAGTNADLEHDFALTLSDIRRFASQGEQVELMLTVTPQDWTFAEVAPEQITFQVVNAAGGNLPDRGYLSLSVDGYEHGRFDLSTLPAQPSVRWVINPDCFPPGELRSAVTFTGYQNQYRPAVSNTVVSQVTDQGDGNITLRVPTLAPHAGDVLPLVCDLFDDAIDGEVPSGVVQYQTGPSLTGPWTNYGPPVEAGGEPQVVNYWTAVPSAGIFWRAVYTPDPDETRWATDTSNVVGLQPLHAAYQTITYDANWSTTYAEDGTIIAGDDLRQGDWADGSGDQRAIIDFLDPDFAQWPNYVITKVEVFLYARSFQNGQGGTVRVGSQNHGHSEGEPPAPPDSILHRVDVSQWPQGTSKWVDITAWGKGLVAENAPITGIAIGPADATDRGGTEVILDGVGQEYAPQLRITGYKWTPGLPAGEDQP